MITVTSANVNTMLREACIGMKHAGVVENSRNGKVTSLLAPVCLEYLFPTERVMFWPQRDANPFFHFMEALWMLDGRNNLAWPAYFNSKFAQYSDDGDTVYGAYGRRWRDHFRNGFATIDQIHQTIDLLRKDPESRRAVIAMWDPDVDYAPAPLFKGRDVPCNTHIYFRIVNGCLNMTVCNRSNDLVWGACGSNAVHFSMLQEFIASALGLTVGRYYQITNNLHIYHSVPNYEWYSNAYDMPAHDPYMDLPDPQYPLCSVLHPTWLEDLYYFLQTPRNELGFNDPFFPEVACPMFAAWEERKEGKGTGLAHAKRIAAEDWRKACVEWIERRETKVEP